MPIAIPGGGGGGGTSGGTTGNPGDPGNPPPDSGQGQGGRGGGRYPGQGWKSRFEDHPVRFLQNHPGRVLQAQQWLRTNGFHITADGAMGPQTRHAAHAFVNNVDPNHWNRNSRWSNTQHVTKTNPAGDTTHPPKNPPGKNPPGTNPKKLKGPPALGKWNILHPVRYAKLETHQQFDQILKNLADQLGTQQGQNKQNQADLAKWWGGVNDQAAQAAISNAAMADANQKAGDAFRQNVIASMGGGASAGAGAVGAFGAFLSANQAGRAANQAAFDQTHQADLKALGASSQVTQGRLDQNKITAIQAAQQDALHQRAVQYQLNLQNAEILRNNQLAGMDADQLARYQAGINTKLAGSQLATEDVQRKAVVAQLKKDGVAGKGMSLLGTPQGRSDLHDSVMNQLTAGLKDQAHPHMPKPNEAWVQMVSILQIALKQSPSTKAKVMRYAKTIWRQYVGQYADWYNANLPKGGKPVRAGQFMYGNGTPYDNAHWKSRGVTWYAS